MDLQNSNNLKQVKFSSLKFVILSLEKEVKTTVGQLTKMELINKQSITNDIFTDKKSGRQFRLFKYFDHEVIQDVETGWINAGTFVRNVNP